ncbi:PQQ-binding-like beta-propeller repeat protein [Metaclostridioides mangenotii]|uniref:PQQ-binding-like beta-propeller repeat protein n=1 Tax=Metaclostridioides mangenotii TaxID=1540 RepID=UPI0026F3201D|nr:PQQ-binding-like beta-propeller repeat protein [Clostridioides mangenotii]
MSLETGASLKEVVDKAEQIDADLQNKKQLIATAVTGKDVPTNGSDSFQKMADNIDSIKTKLPILEGDAGVTEDAEGNVYGVSRYDLMQSYNYMKPLYEEAWSKQTTLYNITMLEVDSQSNLYVKTSTALCKMTNEFEEIWKLDVGNSITSIVVDCEDNVYISLSSTKEIKKITTDGDVIWSCTTSKGVSTLKIGLDGVIYYWGSDYYVMKISPDGVEYPICEVKTNQVISSIDAYSDGTIYVANRGQLTCVSKSGEIEWQKQIATYSYDSIVLIDSKKLINYFVLTTNNSNQIKTHFTISSNGNIVGSFDRGIILHVNTDYIGNIYVAVGYTLTKLSSSGASVWSTSFNSNCRASASSKEGKCYCFVYSYTIKCFNDNYTLEKVAVLKEREVQ